MCGIFAVSLPDGAKIKEEELLDIVTLFALSSSRGKKPPE